MDVQEADILMQFVRKVAERFSDGLDAAISQQILLFDNSFYGYRFIAEGITAIWSISDQTLEVWGREGQWLGNFTTPKKQETIDEIIGHLVEERKAAC